MTQTQTRRAILREEEFVPLLQEASASWGGWIAACLEEPERLHRPAVLAKVSETAHALETFLDDHGARLNQTFVLFGELVASVRGLVGVRLKLSLLDLRLSRYPSVLPQEPLESDLSRAEGLLDTAIIALGVSATEEAGVLGLSWSPSAEAVSESPSRPRLLPRNLDAEETEDERDHIAAIGSRYMTVVNASRSLDLTRVRDRSELPRFVADHATEDRCRWYESAVHNIQSMYDTHVAGTAIEEDQPWLRKLRGHASLALHLLEMATDLIHFYERHENDVRHEPSQQAVSEVVVKGDVLDLAVNICLRQAYLYVEGGAGLADQLLETFVVQREQAFQLPEGLTLHARPLALMVQVARHFGTPLEVTIAGESCPANSLMGLIMLAGNHPKAREISVRGDSRALLDLAALFDSGLGEVGSELPAQLEYLRLGA